MSDAVHTRDRGPRGEIAAPRRLGRSVARHRLSVSREAIRSAVRGLARDPALTLAVVVTFALGIGANALMFGVVDRLLLSPPAHVRDPDRVARLYVRTRTPFGDGTIPVTNYAAYVDLGRAAAFAATGAAMFPNEQPLGRGADARLVRVLEASASFFSLLGVSAERGRFFSPEEDRAPTGAPVAVLSHGLWRRAFGRDPGIVGRTITLGGATLTVVGVAPRDFTGIDVTPVDVYTPVTYGLYRWQGPEYVTLRRGFWLRVVARLRPGVTRARAESEATAILRHGEAGSPTADPNARVRLASLIGVRATREMGAPTPPGDPAPLARVSVWLLGVATAVLLIACANVAGLLLGRSARRYRDSAVRLALGADRARLLTASLLEGVLLAAAGATVALLLAYWGGAAVCAWLVPEVEWGHSADGRVLAVTAVLTLVTGVLSAVAPALHASRTEVAGTLRAAVGTRDGAAPRSRVRTGLLVTQSALLVLLLTGAGLFVRSLRNAREAPLGLDVERLLVVQPDLEHLPDGDARRAVVWEQALAHVRALPGVEAAALSSATPLQTAGTGAVVVPGRETPRKDDPEPFWAAVSPGYFATVGARLVRGRPFAPHERALVVNETMARRYWAAADPIGTCVRVLGEPTCRPVVGVVSDIHRFQIREDAQPYFYTELERADAAGALLVRAGPAGPAALVGAVRRALQAIDPGIAFVSADPLRRSIDPQLRSWRLGAAVFTAFGALALVLAAVGLYGAMAYATARRHHEIGVRLALGVRPWRLVSTLVLRGVAIAGAGLAIGVAVVLAAGRVAAPLLFDATPADPLVLGVVTLSTLGVAALASLAPALRAARVDPVEALRAD